MLTHQIGAPSFVEVISQSKLTTLPCHTQLTGILKHVLTSFVLTRIEDLLKFETVDIQLEGQAVKVRQVQVVEVRQGL